MEKTVAYGGELVSVSIEVAEFLESDKKRQAAEKRSDRRHLSKSDFETALTAQKSVNPNELEAEVFKNLALENLRNVIAGLTEDEQRLIHHYFWKEMSMEQIGEVFGISKMAISKRLKRLYVKMRSSL